MDNPDVKKLKAGDKDAFAEMARLYTDRVFCVAYILLGSVSLSETVTEQTFENAFYRIEEYDGSSRLDLWLLRLAYEKAKENMNRTPHTKAAKVGGLDKRELYESNHRAFMIDIEHDVALSLSILPDDQREAILFKDAYGFTYEEIEAITGVSAGVCKTRVGLARAGMKNILLKKWNG